MYFTPTSSTLDLDSTSSPKQSTEPRPPALVRRQGDGQHSIRVPVRWRTATQYHAAGVRFVKRKLGGNGNGEARSILDVDLIKDRLHVPCLTVDANTLRLLRNMVALEQKSLQQQRTSHVTAYCLFLSQLASTEEDVELLVSKGIIVHLLRSNGDVAEGLAGLCDGVVIDPDAGNDYLLRSKYEALEKLIVVCSGSGGRKSMAWLRSHSKCLLVAALVLLLFLWTAQQSVFSALRNCKCRSP